MKHKLLSIISICLLTCTVLAGCSDDSSAAEPEMTAPQETEESAEEGSEEEETPEVSEEEEPIVISFSATDIEGNTVSSDIFGNSKLTMVNVWATYCNPCLQEMPDLGEIASEYDSADFQLIGVISDVAEDAEEESVTLAKDLIEQTQANYPHLLLNDSLYYSFVGSVTAVPTTFFFNENGELVYGTVGSAEKAAWKELIDELLTEM